MKRKIILALCLALMLTIFSNVSSVFAQDPVGEEATFIVEEKAIGADDSTATLVKKCKTLYEAIKECKQQFQDSKEYIITVTDDYQVGINESVDTIQQRNIILRSSKDKQFTITGNTFNGYKRSMFGFGTEGKLIIENVILDGNNEIPFGGILGATLTIGEGAVLQNFISVPNVDGPAINVSSGGTLNILDGATIQNNSSNVPGGAIQGRFESTINIYGGTFINNKSNTSDGGVLVAYGTLNITGGTFEGNTAKKTGGAILIGSRATATISNATFKNNNASTAGAINSLGKLSISNTTFESNKSNRGGAIFAQSLLSIKSSTFQGNEAAQAGAIFGISNVTVEDGTKFTENKSGTVGGGILCLSKLEVTNCIFEKNEAKQGGGAIFTQGPATIKSGAFNWNKAVNGGALYLQGINSDGTVNENIKVEIQDNAVFKNNSADQDGGAIYSVAQIEIVKSFFESNSQQEWQVPYI